jgi:subtilisin family serine protease
MPRVRAGTLPAVASSGRIRVIARLSLPPLAQRFGRGLASAGAARRLDTTSAASRAYLQRVGRAQTAEAALVRRAIPEARIGHRFQVVLDGLTVSLPASKLPALVRLRSITAVYPSVGYTMTLDRSPSIIGADELRQQQGADGTGMKIAVVDDGIDQTNPVFDPKGFSYPAGFPRGGRRWTTPKVIVARVFPGPNAGAPGRLALDPDSSFHGTHVAGIAAGDSGTTAPAGADHPTVTGLSGVAPRAWLGNYRVFTVPTPIGHVANTPEIVAAFEAAVRDGMNVINFSGGGPQVDPANDALVEAIHNVAAAGVVPVIAAGNDGDDFGLGSAGSPGTAPDAISVAAVSNTHVFAPALDVTAPGAPDVVRGIPFVGANGGVAPDAWSTADQTLVDVGSIVGTDGRGVERHLCGPPNDLASTTGPLPAHSLAGAIALVQRGLCPFETKADQAKQAGAVGIVYADNRAGEANGIPTRLPLPGGMIANLDGDHLRAFLATHGGRTTVRVGHDPLELETGRSGVITSFSSRGPTAFGHDLKPDLSAPGGQILSSTLPNTSESRFAVFDGTSMATPHVAGAAALLLELHPSWTPAQVKSALVSTAGAAWGDTARTQEAPVTLEGAGLVALPRAADPQLFTDPVSLSFEDLNVVHAAASRGLLVRLTDAGDGAGTWEVQLSSQAATVGASIDVPGLIAVPPGGEADVAVVAHAAAGAVQGENYGFIVLRKGDATRRVPYFFLVDRPALAEAPVVKLKKLQSGDTRTGVDRVEAYRYPVAPFGNAPDSPPMVEDGGETVYETFVDRPVVNAGVAIVSETPGARVDPFYLGAQDENSVQGFAGTPVNVNALTSGYLLPIGAAGASFPRQQRFFVVVDSGRDRFDGRSFAGRYTLRSWVDDVTPPSIRLLTTRVAPGRPTLVLRVRDAGAGVDPSSMTIGYHGMLVGATSYDSTSGIAVFPLPRSAPGLVAGTLQLHLVASDFQEAKNIDTVGPSIMPNTRSRNRRIRVATGTSIAWIVPAAGACLARQQVVSVAVSSTKTVEALRFVLDGRSIRAVRKDDLWTATLGKVSPGEHVLQAVASGDGRRLAAARRIVRMCPT